MIHPDGSEDSYEYDRPYFRLVHKEVSGLVTDYDYDDSDRLTRLAEAVGEDTERITEYEYTAEGTRSFMRLTEHANSAFRIVTEESYNTDGNRTQLKEAVGSAFDRITDYAYDTDGNLSTITKHLADGQTAVTEMQYDADGNLSWKRGPDGQEVSYSYVEGQLESMTTAAGTWTYAYDDEGRMTTVSDPVGNTRGREYDTEGNVTAVTVNGQTVGTYTYVDGQLTQRTDAAGKVSRFTYNAEGQLSSQQDPEGRTQHYEYDDQGRLIKTIDGSGNAILREYGPVSDGSSSSCTSCSGGLFSRSDEGVERLQKIIYPTFTKEFRYDADGRVSEEIYVLDGGGTYSVSYSYDQFGRLQSTTGPDGKTTTTHYDLLGRKIMVTGDTGHVEFEYDNWDNLISLSDAKGQITEFVYDSSGRLTQEIRPMQQRTGYEYDGLGRLQKILDAKNQRTEYGYDGQGRIETISYDDGRSVILSYDADGNLAGYDDGLTSASYTYNALGRKLSETVNYGVFTKSFSYSYYANGLKKSFTAPDGTVYEYMYGANNELREVRIPGLGSITISEYQWNRPKTMRYPGGSKREYEYDPLMRLTRLVATDPGGNALLDYGYEYDSSGNIVSKGTEHGTYSYGYDGASRLTSVDDPTLDDESYSYDAVGNRTSASNADGSITHNANNELTVYGEVEYVYDANGNMTEVQLDGQVMFRYHYNADNRLVKAEGGNSNTIAKYSYDPFGRRLWKEVSGVRTYFFYSDEGLVAEYDVSGMEVRSYGYKPDSTWTTDPLFLKQNGQYYFYQNDHLGTPQNLVAQNGAVVWSAQYTAFGQATVEINMVTNNLRFPGQYHDTETGLHYNYHRYYVPEVGRYTSGDPLGFTGGQIHLYGYARENPFRNIDPYGLDVYVVQRTLTMFRAFNKEELQNTLRTLYLGMKTVPLVSLIPDMLASQWGIQLDPEVLETIEKLVGRSQQLNWKAIEGYLQLLDWYANNTWHCIIVVLDCDNTPQVVMTTGWPFAKPNIAEWDKINGNHTADYNQGGVNIPAWDWQEGSFDPTNFQDRVNVVTVSKGHEYDEAVLQAIRESRATVSGMMYDMAGNNGYNCCDWVVQTLDTAGLSYVNPNPPPFGETTHPWLLAANGISGKDIPEELRQQVFDHPAFELLEWLFLLGAQF